MEARLRIDHGQQPDVGQSQLPGVDDVHGDHLVAQCHAPQGRDPVGLVQVVRGDDDDPAAWLQSPDGVERGGEVSPRGGPAVLLGGVMDSGERSEEHPGTPVAAGRLTSRSPPATVTPNRLPARAVRTPNDAAVPSTRSRFSASAVPKSRLAEQSATTQVCSSRSASVVRTWTAWDRAVRFQSIRRASSPGSYCLAPARSLPGPSADVW